jgi:hypothetical protein
MFKLILVGLIIVVACAKAELWPDRFTVDFRGVHWTGVNGTQKFFENENALTATGMIPLVKSVDCVLHDNYVCSRFVTKCNDDGTCNDQVEAPDGCITLKCSAVPRSNKIQVKHKEIHIMPENPFVGMAVGVRSYLREDKGRVLGGVFHPEDIQLDVHAIDSLSVLWYL